MDRTGFIDNEIVNIDYYCRGNQLGRFIRGMISGTWILN